MCLNMMSQRLYMLEEERLKCSFNPLELSYVIHDGKQEVQDFIARQKIVQNDPILKFDPATIHRSRSQLMAIYAKKLIRYTEIIPPNDNKTFEKSMVFPEQAPLSLHEVMFIPTLRNLCDEEQVETFLKPAERFQILGCYAQTELGHGSDIKNLMTTATYNEETEQFIVDTPTAKAAKWWIGDLGVFCTHAVVFAQLYLKGKNYGLHAFVVPIRDGQHKPLPGIEVGDHGPKFGFNCKDNGYLLLNKVRIPRKNMLMKYHRVSKEGNYEIVGDQKITYATMLKVRSLIPRGIFYNLSKAITIVIRYSLIRTQFKDNRGVEQSVLNYQLQQEKIFPRISETYATLFAVKSITDLSTQILNEAKEGNFKNLNEAHVLTSAVKAICTKDGLQGLETLRRASGGHGYSSYSGLPALQTQITPMYTFEGDFTILMLQVARYLLKSYNRIQKGSKKPLGTSVSYLKSQPFTLDTENEQELRNPSNLIKAYVNNSCGKIKKSGEKLLQGVTGGMELKKTWDEFSGIDLVEASIAHSYYWMVNNLYEGVAKIGDTPTKKALEKVFLLYAVEKIIENSTSFFETDSITSKTFKAIRELRQKLYSEIRPDALGLVEAFQYTDHTLMSAIGSSEGRPYQKLLDWAQNYNDVNKPEVRKEFSKISRDLLQFHQKIGRAKL